MLYNFPSYSIVSGPDHNKTSPLQCVFGDRSSVLPIHQGQIVPASLFQVSPGCIFKKVTHIGARLHFTGKILGGLVYTVFLASPSSLASDPTTVPLKTLSQKSQRPVLPKPELCKPHTPVHFLGFLLLQPDRPLKTFLFFPSTYH